MPAQLDTLAGDLLKKQIETLQGLFRGQKLQTLKHICVGVCVVAVVDDLQGLVLTFVSPCLKLFMLFDVFFLTGNQYIEFCCFSL